MSSFFYEEMDFVDKFTDLIVDHAQWSQETFGLDADRGPAGPLKHLAKEALEAVEAVGSPELKVELADCFLLLLDASRRAGVKPTQLVEAAMAKLQVNKTRTWPAPVGDEAVEHIREDK